MRPSGLPAGGADAEPDGQGRRPVPAASRPPGAGEAYMSRTKGRTITSSEVSEKLPSSRTAKSWAPSAS
jgi:hypothetical protein